MRSQSGRWNKVLSFPVIDRGLPGRDCLDDATLAHCTFQQSEAHITSGFPISLVLLGCWATAASAQTLSLNEALKYAIEHSPVLNTALRNTEIAEFNGRSARAKFWPSLDLSSTHGLQKASPGQPADPWISQLSLTLQENLYDNGASLTHFDLSKVNQQVAELQARQARDQLVQEVANGFYRYSLNRKLAEVRQQQVNALRSE